MYNNYFIVYLFYNFTTLHNAFVYFYTFWTGWYFGERESEFPAVGYVPSLRKEGPIRLFEAQQLAHDKGLLDRGMEAEQRGAPEDRDKRIAQEAAKNSLDKKAIRAGSDQEQLLNQTEKNLKFGIFSLT